MLALVIAACGGGEAGQAETTASDAGATTTSPDVTTTAASATTEAPPTDEEDDDTSTGMGGVHTAESELGDILVGPEGFTLYVFTNDTDGESVCYDQCAQAWPAVPSDTPIGSELDAAMFGSATRDDGSGQLTVNGMPLYWFQSDLEAGETNGQGVNGVWFVVDAAGQLVEGADAGSQDAGTDDSVIDYGY